MMSFDNNGIDKNETVAPGMVSGAGRKDSAADNDNLTRPPREWKPEDGGETRAEGLWKREPVVGWLVCTNKGRNFGKDYRLFPRSNSIGRDETNDVCISSDDTISRKNHVRIVYDPRGNGYYLYPAEGKNNVYLNGVFLFNASQLNAYDVIEIGKSKFVFVPLCGERFQWEINEE